MVVIHAPVLSPRYSTILAARGIEVCTQPFALHKTRTWRRVWVAASGFSGKAAIIAEISEGLANCRCGQPCVNPPVNPSGGQAFEEGVCCPDKRLHRKAMLKRADTPHFFLIIGTPSLTRCRGFLNRVQASV